MDEEPKKLTTSQKIDLAAFKAAQKVYEDIRRVIAAAMDSNNDVIFRYMEQLAQDEVEALNSSNAQARATFKNEWKAAKERRAKNK